jgi:hypothetical protein
MMIRARYDGRVLIPVEPVQLAKDQLVELEVIQRLDSDPPHGSPEAILKVLSTLPPLDEDAAQELERAIERGKIPVRYDSVFDDDVEEQQ